MTIYEPPDATELGITVREFLDDRGLDLSVRLVAGGAGLDRAITHPRIQKSGLALVGHLHGLIPSRIQVLGETEISYAESLSLDLQREAARHLCTPLPACIMVTRGAEPPRAFCEEADASGTPLVVCSERSSTAILAIHTLLDERLAPRASIHGVLMDVFEVGVLLLGKSGIGKSECALELLMRGHRLVADDVIECDYRPPGMVFGQAANLLRHHIEVRGLGVLNVKDLYGVTAIRERKRLDLIVQLELWDPEASYDRLGMSDEKLEVLGVPIRKLTVPVRPGRDMSSIIEIAARNELLKQAGHDGAREFLARVEQQARGGYMPTERRGRPMPSYNALGESSALPPAEGRKR